MDAVVITGMGIISALGQGIQAFEKALREGKSGILCREYPTPLSIPGSSLIAAELQNFSFSDALRYFRSLPKELIHEAYNAGRRSPLPIQTSIIAALEAWQQAGLHEHPISSTAIGLVVAGNNIAANYQYANHALFQKEPAHLSPTYALHFMDFDQVGSLSEIFAIHGEGFTIGGASASGNVAIRQGYRLIKHGDVDACMVVGALADLSAMEIQGFYNIGALGGTHFKNNPEKACRPFDREHEGFIWGQASACLLIESRRSAQKRGVPILGEIIGTSLILDGTRKPTPHREAEGRSMQNALAEASIGIDDIDYINAHGSSSPLGDEVEIAAIQDVFGEKLSRIWINSTKSLTGHCLWSAGVVEAIASVIQMQAGFVHPNLNLDDPIVEGCRFARAHSEPATIGIALSNSFGFGGVSSSLILKKNT